MASLPFGRMLAATGGDVHPPGYFAGIWLLVHTLGATPVVLRLPSVVFSLAAFPLVLAIGRRLAVSGPALLVATALLAFSPFELYYAQEARMYALLQLLFLCGAWAVLARRWWALGLCVAGLLYTQNYGLLYSGALAGLAIWRELEAIGLAGARANSLPRLSLLAKNTWPMVAAFVGGGVAYSPWVWVAMHQLQAQKDSWWQLPTTAGSVLSVFASFVFGDNGPPQLAPVEQVVAFGLLAFILLRLVARRDAAPLAATWLAVVPGFLALLAEVFYRPIFLTRALIGCAPFYFLLLGWALGETIPAKRRAWAWAVLAPIMAIAILLYYPFEAGAKGFAWPGPHAVAQRFEPGDIIYHVNSSTIYQWHVDYDGSPNDPQYVALPFAGDRGALSASTVAALGIPHADLAALPWRRAWLVWSAGPMASAAEDAFVQRVLAHYPHEQVAVFSDSSLADLTTGGVWLLQR